MEAASDASERLAELAREYWEERLSNDPLFATALGDRRFDARLPDLTSDGRARRNGRYEAIVRSCEEIPEGGLEGEDRLTRTAVLVYAGSTLEYYSCGLEEWVVDPLQGFQVELMNLESYQPVSNVSQGAAMVER
jgi:uncharacterized protein (DUF885 family)